MSAFPQASRLPTPVRITEQVWPEGTVPVVSIWCITYNHVNFIRDAIEGFLMQETTFPVEILIHDDASTDGTADIVREYQAKYPQLLRTVLQNTNQWSQGNKPWRFLNPLVRGDFVALCEGDDFWITNSKLQKQVDLMNERPKAVLCGARSFVTEEPIKTPYRIEPDLPGSVLRTFMSGPNLPLSFFMRVPTRLMSTATFREYNSWTNGKKLGTGDWTMFMFCVWKCFAADSGILFIDEVQATYREHEGGTWSGSNASGRDRRSLKDIKLIRQLFKGLSLQSHFAAMERLYTKNLAHAFDLTGRERLTYCADALRSEPFDIGLWRSLLSACKQCVFGQSRRR
jgi:glycosyltransferase involved in cell wall biosynthesis